ncbi:MAG: DUF2403 domain-containing lipoprotein [Pseudomonadota bacterium]
MIRLRRLAWFATLALAACGSSGRNQHSPGSSGATSASAGADSGSSGQSNVGGMSEAGASVGGSANPSSTDALGAYPFAASAVTRGGTMTFQNVGAPGWWPRRIDRAAGDPACDYKDGTDTWGAHCCMKQQTTDSATLAPFDEEMTLILKAIDVKQLAIYQPQAAAANASAWQRVTDWDRRTGTGSNLWFTQKGDGSPSFPGDLTKNDCVGYLSQAPTFPCGDGSNYYCPKDPGVLHRGFSGSKLIVFLASMNFDDAGVAACDGNGAGAPGPWVAFVASELIRDGGRKYNGACNCYSKTGSVGDGCGEINVFEVVMDNNDYSNREFASTGVRSFQAGHVGGAVCGSGCDRQAFPTDVEVVDACSKKAYSSGPELVVSGDTDGCPVWRRPDGDRYFFILLDERERAIQVGVIHPSAIPAPAAALLPELPATLPRSAVDALLALRLPK